MAAKFSTIGVIPLERPKNIPPRSRIYHEFCFHLHDCMVAETRRLDQNNLSIVSIPSGSEEPLELLNNGIHFLDVLDYTGEAELERRVAVNHTAGAIYSDMCNFVYEALFAQGSPAITCSFNSIFYGHLDCINRGLKMKISKANTPKLPIGELIICRHRGMEQNFPVFWLFKQAGLEKSTVKEENR